MPCVCIYLAIALVVVLITLLVGAAINKLRKPSAEEQRLMQIQINKELTERELSRITQDHMQRVANHAQQMK